MSLMTDIQGTPERVWALVKLLGAQGPELPRASIRNWMDPFDSDPKGTALGNTISACASLGFVETDSQSVRLTIGDMPNDIDAFADRVHTRLKETPSDHGDSIVLEVLAWFVARSAKEQGTTWVADYDTSELCDVIRNDIRVGEDDKRFNTTRYPRWRDWISFLGLGIDIPRTGTLQTFYPCVTERLARVISKLRLVLSTEKEIEASDFLKTVVSEMPYMDGGALFEQALERVKAARGPRQLSPVLSVALRDLQGDGFLDLRMHGDAKGAINLASDPTEKLQAFRYVTLKTVDG
jgi:hypothetical protein